MINFNNTLKVIVDKFKQIGMICLMLFFPILTFADNITTSPVGCDSATLQKSSGTATLDADWQANTINIEWYSNGQKITNDANAATQCTYDQTFSLPTPPTKTGYNFAGWKVRGPLAGLDISINGGSCSRRQDNGSVGYSTDCVIPYEQSTRGHWRAVFDYGAVEGESSCVRITPENDYPLDYWNAGEYIIYPGNIKDAETISPSHNQDTSGDVYCWCRIISFESTSGQIQNFSSLSWVFININPGGGYCYNSCASDCGSIAASEPNFRKALYGQYN